MGTYEKPCRGCKRYIDGDSEYCPYCGINRPTDLLRCLNCNAPIKSDFVYCQSCGQKLTDMVNRAEATKDGK
jgi:RNA polymerase subunit RPABC4/transcription elongation factor Spt4